MGTGMGPFRWAYEPSVVMVVGDTDTPAAAVAMVQGDVVKMCFS